VRGLILSGIPELLLLAIVFIPGSGNEYLSVLAAAMIHESGHIITAALLGVKMKLCKTGIAGVSLKYDFSLVSPIKEATVCLAGPVIGVIVFLLGYKNNSVSYFAAASLGLTLFNLMPISFLDGGCALSAILSVFLSPNTVWRICRILSIIFTILLWCAAVMLLIQMNGDISVMAAAVYLLYRLFSEC